MSSRRKDEKKKEPLYQVALSQIEQYKRMGYPPRGIEYLLDNSFENRR